MKKSNLDPITGKVTRQKRRAIEHYDHDTPFKPNVEPLKKGTGSFKRKPKYNNINKYLDDEDTSDE